MRLTRSLCRVCVCVCVCLSTSILNQQTEFREFLYEQYAAEGPTYTAHFKRFRLVAKSL